MRKTLLSALQVVVVSLLLLCPVEIATARQSKVAFISLDVVAHSQRRLRWDAVTKAWPHSFMRLGYSNSNEDLVDVVADAPSTITTSRYDAASSTSVVEIDIIIPNHRLLGCVIEESLASSQPNHHVVFVTSITEGGAAAQAGLLPGDVIVGLANSLLQSHPCVGTNITTTTDTARSVVLTNVTGWSIEKVKSFIQCRADDIPFQMRVLRGTNALEEHEAALTEMCANPDLISTEADQCLLDYIQGGYNTASSELSEDLDNSNVECTVNEDECLLDDLHNLWASDLPPLSSGNAATKSSASSGTKTNGTPTAPKPWSSRASPSGTFVRDPTTGRMKNLNEEQ